MNDFEKLGGSTKNLVDENISKLAELFPECVTETTTADGKICRAINFERLKEILGDNVGDGREAYEFNFVGKKQAHREACAGVWKTLRPCREESRDFDTTKNLYIEGDNLDALKILRESYRGKVKLIYIDPPYNTGNDFIYRDKFSQTKKNFDAASGNVDDAGNRLVKNSDSNGQFHSDWCKMIYSRLLLAKNFLADDGAIFISIDDNEQANLRKICDEIFGAKNFLIQMPRVTKRSGKSTDVFAKNNDVVLVYSKSERCKLNPFSHDDKDFKFRDEFFEERGLYKLNQTLDYDSLQYSGSLDYPLMIDGVTYYAGSSEENFLKRKAGEHNRADWAWRWSQEKFNFGYDNGFIVVKQTRNGTRIYTKTYQRATIDAVDGKYFIKYTDRTAPVSSLALTANEFSNDNATKVLTSIFGEKIFDYSKPVALIKFILQLATDKDSIVMDFFSGSATTAHAVMELNAQDGGNRQFIMIQLPEPTPENSEARRAGYKTICDIGKERIRRAADKLNNPALDAGFRVFKVDSSNIKPPPENFSQETLPGLVDNIEPDRDEWDLFFGCLLQCGLSIQLPVTSEQVDGFTVLNYNDGEILACFDKSISFELIKTLATRKPKKIFLRDAAFNCSAQKINATKYLKTFAAGTEVKII